MPPMFSALWCMLFIGKRGKMGAARIAALAHRGFIKGHTGLPAQAAQIPAPGHDGAQVFGSDFHTFYQGSIHGLLILDYVLFVTRFLRNKT